MGKAGDVAVAGGAAVALLLDFCGWVILLAGVSAMQYSCGGSDANLLLSGGSAGYNGAVSCDVYFSYSWWFVFYNLFVLIVSSIALAGSLAKFRPGLVALQAVAAMQAIVLANNYLYFNDLAIESGTLVARAKVAVAGAVIKAIASLLFIAAVGARDEWETVFEPPSKRAAMHGGYRVDQGGLGPPVSTNVLSAEPETIGVRPGRVAGAPASAAAAPAGAGTTVGTTTTTVTVSPV